MMVVVNLILCSSNYCLCSSNYCWLLYMATFI